MLYKSLPVVLAVICAAGIAACGSGPRNAQQAAAVRSSPARTPAPLMQTTQTMPSTSASAGRQANCPAKPVLVPGPHAARAAVAAAVAAIPRIYSDIRTSGYRILQAAAATRSTALGSVPYGMCGSTVGARTWIVRILFPLERPSADLSHGVLFTGRFADGWRVWFRWL
jgi:hypothetical protein